MRKMLIISILLLLVISISAQKDLLLLYKRSEEYGEFMLKNYVVPFLEKNGIDYELQNVEELNFYKITNEKYFGVVTWYYSSELNNSHLYLRQLASFVENGGLFFFFNNLGVSVDTDIREINNLLNKIGVHYQYGYKELENYKIDYNEEFFSVTPSNERKVPVEKYIVFGKYVRKILTYKDNEDEYPMIFLSNNGGAAVFNSFMGNEGKVILDINKLIHAFLYHEVGTENKILIVTTKYDNARYLSSLYELQQMLKYAKLNFKISSVDEFYKLSFIDLTPYKYIIWNTDAKYIETKTIKRFINSGGTFIFSTELSNSPWKDSIIKDNVPINKIVFSKNVFPLSNSDNGEIYIERSFELSYNLDLPKDNTVLSFYAGDSKRVPSIWYKKKGYGYIGYINPDSYLKESRGLILQSILSMQTNSIAGFLNSFIFYLDDFPIPSYNIIRAKIEGKEVTDDEYYYKIWWPSMKTFSKEYNIKCTIVTPLSYNGSSNPPFEFTEFLVSKTNSPLNAIREIDQSEHELGLHGYNHNSLTKDRWANPNNIVLSLKAAKDFLEKIVGHPIEISSYVAPNNLIDEFGASQLLKAIPEIKTIGTSYGGANNEFSEYKILNNFTIVIPRSTYGYYPLNRLYLSTINTMANFGAFQHFIHPDDLFDTRRNPERRSWNEMYSNLRTFYNTIKNKFPWLRNHTASEAYHIYFDYLSQNVKYKWNDNTLTVILSKSSLFPKYFMVKAKETIKNIDGGKILDSYENSKMFIIEMNSNIMKIEFFKKVY